LKEHKPK